MAGSPTPRAESSRLDGAREAWFLKAHDLMRFMVREILVVSSTYDAFILEEDGRLDLRLMTAYSELSISSIPRITNVTTAREAMELLEEQRFDLVLTVVRLADTDARGLSRMIKDRHPTLPVVLLAFDEADLERFPGGVPSTIDRVFLWSGDAQILIAAIKLIEDARNVEHDTQLAGVRVIIVVEDALRRYSSFLALLYAELMTQARSLIAEGLNPGHRIMRMRARPKILLACTFEEAISCYERYRDQVMAVISDVRFPRNGVEDPEAGFALARHVRADSPDLPLILQSAETEVELKALEVGAVYANKNSPTLLDAIRGFLKESLGFGDFVFRLPDRTEVARATDLYELEQRLHTVPVESLNFHAARNHFSVWLNARGMFSLASRMRPRKVDEFADAETLRRFLIDVLRDALSRSEEGVIADFSRAQVGPDRLLVRLGSGSIGGKGRGIAFVNAMIARHGLAERLPGMEVHIPRTVAVGTDEFDRFLEDNAISRAALVGAEESDIRRRFLEGQLRPRLLEDLELAARQLTGPIAVRSSSLLEDSRYQPFAGIYTTYILPNNHADPKVRAYELRQAIKAVYASTFSREAQSYFAGTPHRWEEEKMAVVIQEMVGRAYGARFYPHLSGVAQSHNYYPVGPQRAEEGVAMIALGLGHAVVSGGMSLRFSPAHPAVLPQFATPRDFLFGSQTKFYALDLSRSTVDFRGSDDTSLKLCGLDAAEADGTLALVGSVYVAADDVIRDSLQLAGPRVVTFNNLLKWGAHPFASAVVMLLDLFRKGLGSDVELELALDLPPPGVGGRPRLFVLQARPMATLDTISTGEDLASVPPERVLGRTKRALGHGRIDVVRDVIYVSGMSLDVATTRLAARQVGRLTEPLRAAGAPYLLVGPGRWGTADPSLGIPVEWSQIAGVRAIIETSGDGRAIEPSQGTHFLQNITFQRIGYLTIAGVGRDPAASEYLDRAWLERQPVVAAEGPVRHIHLDAPLSIRLNGRLGEAVIAKGDSVA